MYLSIGSGQKTLILKAVFKQSNKT